MGVVVDLYELRLKVFFGSLRATRSSLLLFLVYFVGMLPATIGLSMGAVALLQGGADLTPYADMLTAVTNAFTALFLIPTYRGFKVFEYEQEFILTSPVTPRQYLVAGLLFDATTFLVFFNMLPILFTIVAVSLSLAFTAVLSIAFSVLLFIFFLAFLKDALAIAAAVHEGKALKMLFAAVEVILLFPAVGLFTPLPVRYGALPYPATFLTECVLGALSSKLATHAFLGLGLYFLAFLAVFLVASRKNFFPFTSPIPLMSPFDTSARVQAIKVGKSLRVFSRLGFGMTLNLSSRSTLRFLMKKEFVRMVRDGSLFNTFLFYVVLALITLFSVSKGGPVPLWLYILMLYALIVPSMLISMWRVVEMDSLWIPLTSGMDLHAFVRAILYDLTLIAFAVPAAFIAVLAVITQIDPLMPLALVLSVSMVGCATNLYTVVRFVGRKHRATPWMMIGWVALLLTALLLTPTYAFGVLSLMWNLSFHLNAALSSIIILYSAGVFLYLAKATGRRARAIEL